MAIAFPNLEFPGTHESPQLAPPKLNAVRTHFAGTKGETELILGSGSRPIQIAYVMHSLSLNSAEDVVGKMITYDQSIGYHGELEISGAVPRKYSNCTFEGFTPVGSPLRDVANTLNDGASENGEYWFVRGVLVFTQLSVEDDA